MRVRPMTRLEDLAVVVELASETATRTKREQQSLLRVATQVDAEWNRMGTNPRLRDQTPTECTFEPGCSETHSKRCKCAPVPGSTERFLIPVPKGGWSRLVRLVDETWEPEMTSA